MTSKLKSRYLLKTFLDGFDLNALKAEGMTNLAYLDFQLSRLENMKAGWETTSRNPSLSVKTRTRARDLAQNAEGLLAGIRFGISFVLHQDNNLDQDVPGIRPN